MIIYKIQNKLNGKIYIGQTMKDVNRRIAEHLKAQSHIGNALRKYGIQCFDVMVIDVANDREILCDKEMEYINLYDCKHPNGYNHTDGGEGVLNLSQESRDRISKSMQGDKNPCKRPEVREKISKTLQGKISWNAGIPMSEEAKKKSVESHTGKKNPEHSKRMKGKYVGEKHPMYGKHHTEESNRKNRASNIGKNSARYGKPAWNSGLTKETDERVKRMYNKEGATLH